MFSAFTLSSNEGMGSDGDFRSGTAPGSDARSSSLPSLSWASSQAWQPTVPQRTRVTDVAPPAISAFTGMACSLAIALRIPWRPVFKWGKNITLPWARLRWGAEARVNVTPASVQLGTALPTAAFSKVRTISPAAFLPGAPGAGPVVAGAVAGDVVGVIFAAGVIAANTIARAAERIAPLAIRICLAAFGPKVQATR